MGEARPSSDECVAGLVRPGAHIRGKGGWRLGRKVGDGDEERRRKVEVGSLLEVLR